MLVLSIPSQRAQVLNFFGQLQYIVIISFSKARNLKQGSLQYSQSGILDPTDIKSIQCIVGCIEDWGRCGLVDHSGLLAHAVFAKAD